MSWRESILMYLGLYVPPIHPDPRVHAAANKEQISLSGLYRSERRTEKALNDIIETQMTDPRPKELKEAAQFMRQTLKRRQDTLDVFVRGKRK